MAWLHSSRAVRAGAALATLHAPALALAQAPDPPPVALPAASSFTVIYKGAPVGSEQIALTRTSDGWTIVSSGRMGAPLDVVARRVEVRYTEDWKPIQLIVDATINGVAVSTQTTVIAGAAQTHAVRSGQSSDRTDPIAAGAVLLPSPFWGPFEALAARLKTAPPGSSIPVFAGSTAAAITVGDSAAEQIQTTARLVDTRRTRVKLTAGTGPLDIDVWTDEAWHLIRLTIPSQSVDVARDDIASVAARRVTISTQR